MIPLKVLATVLDLELVGDEGATRAWHDLLYERGIEPEVFSDESAEFLRVTRAGCDVEVMGIIDRVPRPLRLVRVGGLKAISPSVGGDLTGWMAANVARLWRAKSGTLFRYVTKRKTRLRQLDAATGEWVTVRAFSEVRKKQRWETRDYVDIGIGNDSPAHLSGFGSGPDGETKTRGVSGPRGDPKPEGPLHLTNEQFDFQR